MYAYLVCQVTPLQSQVGADVLVDGPCEFIVQLPCDEGEQGGCECHQTRQGDEHGPDVEPELRLDILVLVELVGGVPDLVELDGGVDGDTDVVDDESDDLNGILQSECVPHEPQLVQVAEHEDGKVCWDGAGLAVFNFGLGPFDAGLELAKDVAVGHC